MSASPRSELSAKTYGDPEVESVGSFAIVRRNTLLPLGSLGSFVLDPFMRRNRCRGPVGPI